MKPDQEKIEADIWMVNYLQALLLGQDTFEAQLTASRNLSIYKINQKIMPTKKTIPEKKELTVEGYDAIMNRQFTTPTWEKWMQVIKILIFSGLGAYGLYLLHLIAYKH